MTRSERETWLRERLAAVTKADAATVGLDDDLGEAVGLDSLGTLELLAMVEDRYDFVFPENDMAAFRTLRSVLEAVDRHARPAALEVQS